MTPKKPNYHLEFTVDDLPKTPNTLLGKPWRIRAGNAKTWERHVWAKCWHLKPKAPLTKAKLTLIRCSSRPADYDNLVGSFKSVIDALVKIGILIDDNHDVIGVPTYLYEKAGQKKGKIKVIVEGL